MNKYKKYTKRSFLRINEDNFDEFEKFFNSHDQIMIKANEDSGGTGIEKINTSDYDVKELFDKLLNNNSFVEEVIKQDDRMAALMPNSINTIRIMTKNFDGNPQVLFACVRCGRGACVDNFHSGGMGSNINIDTGIVYTKAVDKDNNRYDKHPVTGVEFVGFEIPMWKEICEICKEAHKITPNSKVVGWDVAISKDGPCLVEGNNSPGWDLIQTAEKKGLYYIFRQLLNDAENVK